MYLKVRTKFIFTCIITILWVGFCIWLDIPWINKLAEIMPMGIGIYIIGSIAILQGIMVSFVLTSVLLDKPNRKPIIYEDLEPITILIAAYNEEKDIYNTIASVSKQNYPQQIILKIIDNNSTDNTKKEIERAQLDFKNIIIEYLFESTPGKCFALNTGLATVTTRFFITLDADTLLYKNALLYITNAIIQENKNKEIAAIAGSVLVRNSRETLMAKMQEWDYFLAIAAIKRVQGLFQAVLVAQGAFSIYTTKIIQDIGGWKDTIGEDIVLTWQMFSHGAKIYYEDRAVSFTSVPTTLVVFARQRKRWARGMIEGFKWFKPKTCSNFYALLFIFMDIFMMINEFSIVLIYFPAVIAAICFHWYYIVGPMAFILLPFSLTIFTIEGFKEKKYVFDLLGLKVRKNWLGLFGYLICWFFLMPPICVSGYLQEFFGAKRKWK